jgi:hypothetical protein
VFPRGQYRRPRPVPEIIPVLRCETLIRASRPPYTTGVLWSEGAPIHFSLTTFERRRDKLVPAPIFVRRMLRAIGLWFVIVGVGLIIGIAGYAGFEGLSLVDAYLNAAMILSGMGPAVELKTTGGKVFAGTYAIFSGLLIIIATGFVLAPIFHRVLHKFHLETRDEQ